MIRDPFESLPADQRFAAILVSLWAVAMVALLVYGLASWIQQVR